MEVAGSHQTPPRSPRSMGSLRHDSLPPDLVDTRIKLILLPALKNEDADDLKKALDDPSCHRSTIVRSEKLSVYVYVEKAVIQQFEWNQSDIHSMTVDVTLHECQAPSTIGRYYPTGNNRSSDDERSTAGSNPVIFPDGSVCFIMEITVGERVYDEIQAHIEFPQSTFLSDISGVDIDDLSVFKSATPGFNFLKSLSRNEENLEGISGQHLYSSLKIEVIEPVQVGWDRETFDSTILWSIRIRSRLRDGVIVINRFRLLFSSFEESLICLNRDRVPISLQSNEVYCFVFSVSHSCKSIPIASLTLQSEAFSSPIMYQVQLTIVDRDQLPLNMCLQCPSEVLNHSTFAVAVTVSNNGPTARDLEIYFEPARSNDESVVKPFLSLDKSVNIGTLSSGQAATANLHFLALREGLISFSNITVRSRTSGNRFVQNRPLVILISSHETRQQNELDINRF